MDAQTDGTGTPVLLNVYDLTPVNDYLYWLGFGVFHSGIEVHGMEYGFGAHDFSSSGVFEVESKCCPGFVYRKTVWLGTTDMSREEFRSFIEKLAGKYHGNTYHLISKNCNHFTDDVCKNLTGKPIPGWVNRLARVGSVFDCLLPESVQVSPVGRVPTLRPIIDDDSGSVSSSDSDEGDEDKHLLPAPSTDLNPVDVPLKLAKDLL
ncbi:deSI-like protein At4g17486 [Lolium rigidum]|uniref:deSI-like protein At4g17486 n=1 Tax=Lolium rigidum TaxID=89674 RepID=UPI001F5E301D|nr:deSI-like protein At4g17486 [Lolium rigidum]